MQSTRPLPCALLRARLLFLLVLLVGGCASTGDAADGGAGAPDASYHPSEEGHPWTRDDYSPCAHGGDPSSCSGHGVCEGQTYNASGLPTGAGGQLQSHAPLMPAPAEMLIGDTTLGCECEPGWGGKACSVNLAAGETTDPETEMVDWDGRTYTIDGAGREVPTDEPLGTATWSLYSRLANAAGTCAQVSWPEPFRPDEALPYRLESDGQGGWVYGERIEGIVAVNNLQYGERVLRPDRNYPNPPTSCENQPSGKACGGCWELDFSGGESRSFVVLDRCGGNCYGYPAAPTDAQLAACHFPERFREHAGQGADWRRLLDEGESEECIRLLTDNDCANFFLGERGFEPAPDAAPDAPSTAGYHLAMAPSSHFQSGASAREPGRTYRELMFAIRGIDRADHCAHNAVPHFDIDGDSATALGLGGVGTLVGYRSIPCSPIGVAPDGSYQGGVSWPNGCDRDNWTNCGDLPEYDPYRSLPDEQACCSGPDCPPGSP